MADLALVERDERRLTRMEAGLCAALHLGVAAGNLAQELFAIALEGEKMGIAPRRFVRRIGRKAEGQ